MTELHPSRAERAIRIAEDNARRARLRWKTTVWSSRVALFLILVVGWELATRTVLDPAYASSPSRVVAAWWDLAASGLLWEGAKYTLTEFAVGYGAGVALGLGISCALLLQPTAYRLVEPFVLALRGIPMVALAPLLVLWFGLEMMPKIVLAALETFLIVMINTVAGIRSTNRQTISVLQVMGASRLQLYRQLEIPSAVPFILTALRITIPIAMIGTVIGEFLGATAGLGHLIEEQATFLAVDKMMAVTLTLTMSVIAFRVLLLPLEAWANARQ